MSTTLRLSKILDVLQKTNEENPIQIKHILSRLNQAVDIRTLQRDLKKLREDFMIPIENIIGKGYYLSSNDYWSNSQNLARFFEMEATIEELKNAFLKNKNGLVYVDLEKNEQFKGLKYIKSCLEAITKGKVIEIKHQKFNSKNIKTYTIQPYMLKEYQNRWYIVGVPANSKETHTYGLDRVTSLQVMNATFKRNLNIQPEIDFARVIGLNYADKKSQKITLEFTASQGKYIQTLPLHSSQKVVYKDEYKITIELNVIPNHELKQKILLHTPLVKVIEPDWLRNEVVTDLKKGLETYC